MKLTFEVSNKLSEEETSILNVMISNMIYDYELEHNIDSLQEEPITQDQRDELYKQFTRKGVKNNVKNMRSAVAN